ncbi:hypothetical protein Cadr_000009180 [Camelus dromedarius]|uniref:Uncharacterized protein n=1 Tax=Camelus dromedarius TaxID=9838 RepID=A0A5N4DJU3_CAMDR|nr:hypothetical protein Cadr_000009180 [Camelus dromedarius]
MDLASAPPQEYLAMSDDISGTELLDYKLIEVKIQGWPAMEALGKAAQGGKHSGPRKYLVIQDRGISAQASLGCQRAFQHKSSTPLNVNSSIRTQ